MKSPSPFALILTAALGFSSLTAETAGDAPTWEPPYVGSDPTVLYLPDAHAVYWRYGWKRKAGDTLGLVIEGKFPDARYLSYNVYNDDTKQSLGSFTDFMLKPEGDAPNPFSGIEDAKPGGDYKIYILPEGSEAPGENVLYFGDDVTTVSAMIRHYLPVGGIEGGQPLPTVSLIDSKSGEISAAPASSAVPKLSKEEAKKYLLPLLKKLAKEFETDPEATLKRLHHRASGESLKINELVCKQVVANTFSYFKEGGPIESYNFQTDGTYPNKDNYYLTIPIIRNNPDEVLLVKCRAPGVPENPGEYPDSDLRYFSFSQGDEITHNFATTYDKEIKISDDGMIYLLIGDPEGAVKLKAESLGVNFMPWLVKEKMLLVYRHMKPHPDYKFGINSVPVFDKTKSNAGQEGSSAVGDYAPVGSFLSQETVLSAESVADLK